MSSAPSEQAEVAAKSVVPKRDRARAQYSFVIKVAAGLALLAFLVWHFDLRATFREIEHERPVFFAAAVALYLAGQLMSAFRWQFLARLGHISGTYREYAAYYFIGMFTNVFVPGLIGGDALRALYLGRRHNRIAEAIASVIVDRGIGLLTLFWFAAAAALLVTGVRLPPVMIHLTLAIGAASLFAYATAAPTARLVQLMRGRVGRLLTPLVPYMGRPVALIPAILLSAILQFFLATCQYLLGLGLGLNVPLATFILVVPMVNVITSIPITINGLGMREAAYLVLLGLAGVSHTQAVALSLLYFAATLCGGLTGIVPFTLVPMPHSDRAELAGIEAEASYGGFG